MFLFFIFFLGKRCPHGWLFLDTRCYWQSGDIVVNFTEAVRLCTNQDADLVSISNDSYLSSIINLFGVRKLDFFKAYATC